MQVGVIAIGRNEGERLRVCLESALRDCAHVVYVDSGSTDGSVKLARDLARTSSKWIYRSPSPQRERETRGLTSSSNSRRKSNSCSSSMAIAKSSKVGLLAPSTRLAASQRRASSVAVVASVSLMLRSTTPSATSSGTRPSARQDRVEANCADPCESLPRSQRLQPDHHRRRRAGDVRAIAREGLGDLAHRRGDDAARCGDDEVLAMVEAHASLGTCVRRRIRTARRTAGMSQREAGAEHLGLGGHSANRVDHRVSRFRDRCTAMVLGPVARICCSIRC